MEQILPILGIATGLLSIAGALISVGREKQARVDLERRHGELAKEARDSIIELKTEKTRMHDKLGELEREQTALKTRYEELRSRVEDVKREKASVEAVEALRESVGRVEGTLLEVARRLDMIAQEIMKNHAERRDREGR
jgi:predicted nuclease with TOPRIM domain